MKVWLGLDFWKDIEGNGVTYPGVYLSKPELIKKSYWVSEDAVGFIPPKLLSENAIKRLEDGETIQIEIIEL